MSYSYPYTQLPKAQPKRPGILSMLIGFVAAVVVGILFGVFCSVVYTLISGSGSVECLTVPMIVLIGCASGATGFFMTRYVDQKIAVRK